MQDDNNQQDMQPQSGYDELANALTSLAQNVMSNTLDVGNKIKDIMCKDLIKIVRDIDRQLTEQINQINDTVVNQLNSNLQSTKLNQEIVNAGGPTQSEAASVSSRDERVLRSIKPATADNRALEKNIRNWSEKTKNNNNQQGL